MTPTALSRKQNSRPFEATLETAGGHNAARRRGLVKWGLIFCFWTVLGLLYTSQLYVGLRMEGMNHSFWRLLAWQLLGCWYGWVAFTPLILQMGKHFPVERSSWKQALPIHIVACIILSAIHSAMVVVSTLAFKPYDEMTKSRPFGEMFWGRLTSEFHLELIVYGMILGVGYAFSYYSRYREKELRTSQLEAQLAQAQLQALKMQLHPHFLFNTLNGIAGLVRDSNNKAAVQMIAGLSDLLRYTLENAGKQEVPLREELEFLELYLDIQQMRFPDRLNVQMKIATEALDAQVPNLILQPLVENAIRHGISLRASMGTVGVSARRDDGLLEMKVYDDGPGLNRQLHMEEHVDAAVGGIGLSNTRARLRQLYGERYRFDVHDRDEGGVEAVISIPLRLAGNVAPVDE
ncbi:MAG TPA: histidine kinase [Pyrinomonadaceae bacterium]|nr:histidine kinase [Pyrinomonadaceae bacterium]